MKTMTKEDLYFLHDVVKNHTYWNLGTQYGLTSLQDMCEQLHKLQKDRKRGLFLRYLTNFAQGIYKYENMC